MKAIIIAAGMGSRLGHHTDERPKCMVEVGGRSILSYQLEALRENGVDELHIVRGYLAERLVVDGATYWENDEYRDNNILFSLFKAEPAMRGEFFTTYSDIVYTAQVVRTVKESGHDIALAVDRRWADAYQGRDDHPPEQAELTVVESDRVVEVGKHVTPDQEPLGEYIGLAYFTERGGQAMRDVFADVRARLGDDEPFQAAKLFRKAYQTDIFEEMIDRGISIGAAAIDGGWREIDTIQDLERVRRDWAR